MDELPGREGPGPGEGRAWSRGGRAGVPGSESFAVIAHCLLRPHLAEAHPPPWRMFRWDPDSDALMKCVCVCVCVSE